MPRPAFISLDGLDGTGKSTQSRLLVEWLAGQKVPVTACADPGGTAIGQQIRQFILFGREHRIAVATEALLFMASRAQLVDEVIRPALERGDVVVSDRFTLANVVYQGHAGGMNPKDLWTVGRVATGGLEPDLTLVFDLELDAAFARRNREADRMEERDREFHARVQTRTWTPCSGRSAARSAGCWRSSAGASPASRVSDDPGPPHHPCDHSHGTPGGCMSWDRIRGHDEARQTFQTAWARARLGQAYLFVGPDGVGKRLFARELAKALLCEHPPAPLTACDRCPSCAQVEAGTHPDVFTIRTPEGKHELPIDEMRAFCGRMAMKPSRGSRKVGIVEDADDFNDASANCFLKTLEEPPPGSLLILLATGSARRIWTRCWPSRGSMTRRGGIGSPGSRAAAPGWRRPWATTRSGRCGGSWSRG